MTEGTTNCIMMKSTFWWICAASIALRALIPLFALAATWSTCLLKDKEIEWTTHYSIVRMKDLGVRKGDARKSRLAGRARRLQNQPATGTISMYTLRGILRRGTEHIWVCPECRDVAPVNK